MNQNQPKYRHTHYTTIILAALVIFSIFFENYSVHSSENLTDELVETKFILGWEPNEHSIQSAITFKLSDSWKTYWRNPGEYGIEPTFDWRKSKTSSLIDFIFMFTPVKVVLPCVTKTF